MILKERLSRYKVILASGSPRRKLLLEEMGLQFSVLVRSGEEHYPEDMPAEEVAGFLSNQKAEIFERGGIETNQLIITADTIVVVDGNILGKPVDSRSASDMLNSLSGRSHEVITGVTLMKNHKRITFSTSTTVVFKHLSQEEIDYYIEVYQPFDKAGAYGIQEWIGHVAIDRIEGSYFNVMGLPTHQLYEALLSFVD